MSTVKIAEKHLCIESHCVVCTDEFEIIAGGTESSVTLVEWALAEELDRVVGKKRWVEEKDIGGLEYLQAIMKEMMRLHPMAPMLVPCLSKEPCKINVV